jgi:hypothetical protein
VCVVCVFVFRCGGDVVGLILCFLLCCVWLCVCVLSG